MSPKFNRKNYQFPCVFTLMNFWSSQSLIFLQMFALKGVVRFVIEYTWISTLSHVAAFILRLRELSWRLTRWLILEDFAIWAELVSEKVFNVYEFLMRRSHAFVAKLNDKSFFWFPATMSVWEGEQHGVSIEIVLNCTDLNLWEGVCIFTSFHLPDCRLYLVNVLYIYISVWFR